MSRRARTPSFPRALLALLVAVLLAFATEPSAGESAAVGVAKQHRVTLKVYFRAFCPACQWFVSDPLLELVRNEQFRNVVDLQLFPAAGMAEVNGELDCEGGALECTGHRLEVCMMEKDRHDVVKYLGTIACMEGDESGRPGDWSEKMKNCLTPEERAVVDECYKNKADDILREMIHKHKSGSVEWMPFTVVDEKVLGTETEGVGLEELQASICSAYKGPKQFYPDACAKLVGEQRSVAAPATEASGTAAAAAPAAEAPAPEDDGELELDMKGDAPAADEAAADAPAPTATGKVRLEVYWRAFCPGCMAFIGTPLLQLLRDKEFRDSIDFRPVPAAGTFLDDEGKFVCSMGLVECMGHKWMSCAIDVFPKVEEQIEYLACLESKDNKGMTWSGVIAKCFPGDNAKKMRECYDTRADELLKQHVAQREKVDVLWVPYVLINGSPIGDARHGIGFQQLSDEVCKGFSGPVESRPSACQPKRLRAEPDAATPAATEKVIKPCPPKKDAQASPTPVDDDAPGIGARVETDPPLANANANANDALVAARARAGAPDADADAGSSALQSLVAPGVLLVAVAAFAVRYFQGDHKKDA